MASPVDASPLGARASRHKHAAAWDTLVLSAIQLFAQQGVQGVSLRAVGELAGQRNTAAVHYHFGNRECLLAAALSYTLEAIREPVNHTAARAVGLDVSAPPSSLHEVLGLAFLPILTLPLRHPDWGEAGARLLARVILGEAAGLAQQFEIQTSHESDALLSTLHHLLPEIPEPMLKVRIDFAMVSVVCGLTASAYLAAVANVNGNGHKWSTDALLDYITAGLSAPITASP